MASFGEVMAGLAKINADLQGRLAVPTPRDLRTEVQEAGWRDKVKECFEEVREFAKETNCKDFSIELILNS